ncbi:Glycosyltransferase involved in cell wall bisynthesis [Salinimicrobium sediminis]|uniref:Glycosyltransferase involved in cell wall bisynthesis n=1 Tax=Salinimicrobium sediminis TaxID=1343891 RepID=A0A285X7J2_9FLAO|nr:glycosyltransferase family 4 protein [Salinimicrobium sediminis]SOC81317.1 Glycosyltransferase involved in cell wall bisynthesis [Salinimicrobium sediminis]
MKILHLSAAEKWGGGENHLENLCHELKNEISNTVFCVAEGMLHERLKKNGTRIIPAPLANKMDPRFVLKLARTCKKEKFDLLHIHDSTALTLAVMADHFGELPPFIFSKKTSFPIRPRRQTLFKYNYPKVKKILCVSEATRRISSENLIGQERLEVIYHGTRLDNKRQKSPFWIRDKYEIPEGAKLVGNIGNHIEAKDLETFIRTAHHLVNLKQQKDLYFIQIGSFSRRTEALLAMVEEFQLQKHVIFTDYIPEASALIPQFDVMLLTSENEGIPQVIYESFYYNVPVISTEVGGIAEVIEDEVNGFLCKPYDHTGIGEKLLFLIANPQVIPTFAKISREKLLQHFTSDIMAQKTLKEYKTAINGRLYRGTE